MSGFEETIRELLKNTLAGGSLAAYFLVLAGGVLTSFTPCIFPIIPIIVGFIGARPVQSRTAAFLLSLAYVVGMSLTFAVLGGLFAFAGNMLLFSNVQNSPYSYLVVGNVILIMALWIMDIITIPLPALPGPRITGKGYLPSFLLGATSGLIAAPCTAAILGVILLYVGQSRNVLFGTTLLFTYGLGLGAVLIIAGTFTGFVTVLMKSGKFSLVVKKVFGIALLLLAEYFFFQAGKRFF